MFPQSIPADPTDPAWHAARRTFIGASEAAAVLGLSRWDNPIDVWAEKLQLVEPKADTIPMSLGRELEDWIARRWQAANPTAYVHAPRSTVRHPRHPHIAASVDRVIGGADMEELLECKYVGANLVDEWADGPPVYVQVQVQVQMAVTSTRRVHVCALLAGRRPDDPCWVIDRDDDAIATILERLDAWWQRHIVGQERPALDGDQERITGTLGRLYPPPENSTPVRLGGLATGTIAELRHAKALRKDLDEDIGRLENELRGALGDGTDGYVDDNEKPVVTWRPQNRTGCDYRVLLDEKAGPDERLDGFQVEQLDNARAVLRALETVTTSRVLRLAALPKEKASA